LGRLAACFLDSLATMALPGRGYGIRYEYGMFKQNIVNGRQAESPDYWLEYGNAWEFPRHSTRYKVRFGGRIQQEGSKMRWLETEEVIACAYDQIIPGFDTDATNTLRLWGAQASNEINLGKFNQGDYFAAVEDKNHSENVSRVLYPDDSTYSGRELRLRQEYFLVSATVQDILNRHWMMHKTYSNLAEKFAIHLNDTHPVLAIPELMRLLIDEHKFKWIEAWTVVRKVFSYTNHTLMQEALEAAIAYMFETQNLHRIMANYIPGNERSARLLERLGFEREGYAKAYLNIAGRWQDHVLTARVNPRFETSEQRWSRPLS
jgi:starch phosphorylase